MLNKICCDVLCSVVQLGVLRNDGRELGEAEGYINMYSRKITSPNDDKEARKWGEPARNSGGDCPTGPQQAVYQLWSSNPNSPLDVKVYLDEQQAGDQTTRRKTPTGVLVGDDAWYVSYCHGLFPYGVLACLQATGIRPLRVHCPKLN